jgi:tetratricopeptide (TPR) repeat protein
MEPMKSIIRIAALLMASAMPAAAEAKWLEATTRHFAVYSEGGEQELREFAGKLEKFDYVLRTYHQVTKPASPIKLKVYLLPTIPAVGRMIESEGVAGYYIPDARGLMMVGTHATARQLSNDARTARADVEIDAESILLHEYTHHFMYQYFPAAYPTWYSEGFAEFWGATDILKNDVVEIGLPADYRFRSFSYNRWLPLAKLFTAQSYADVPELDLLYAQGWLLVRHAFENPQRRKQIQTYLTAINGGETYEQAMNRAFGNVAAYNDELFAYAARSKFSLLRLPFKKIEVGEIAIRAPGPAEDSLMEYSIKLAQGVRQRTAAKFADEVRQAAARFPDDPFALALLTEAERLAGNAEAAAAVADRLVAKAPNDPRALLQKGLAEHARLKSAASGDAKAWDAARRFLVRAVKAAPNDPLALEAYYDSFAARGMLPPDEAQAALYRAMELAPSDSDLRYKVAADFEKRDMIDDAIAIIRPVAFELPHAESDKTRKRREELEEKHREAGTVKRETARQMLDRLLKKRSARAAAPAR